MTYRFLSPALAEISAVAEFYDAQVPGLGADFIDEIDKGVDLILRFPMAWSQLPGDYRYRSLRRFPYSIVYTLESADLCSHRLSVPSTPGTAVMAAQPVVGGRQRVHGRHGRGQGEEESRQ